MGDLSDMGEGRLLKPEDFAPQEQPLNPPLFKMIDLNNRQPSKFGDKEQLFFPRDARKDEWVTNGAIFYKENEHTVSAVKASPEQITRAKQVIGERVLDSSFAPKVLTALDEIPSSVLTFYHKLGGTQSAHINLCKDRHGNVQF